MSIFGTKIDINEELKEVREAEKALLVDVREPEEYAAFGVKNCAVVCYDFDGE